MSEWQKIETAPKDEYVLAGYVGHSVCDWWGARLGYADNRMTWRESVAMNLESKGKYLSVWQVALVHEVAVFLEQTDPKRAGK